jgi:hypothetical protein
MRTWVRSPVDERCGSCGRQIPAGDPVLELRMAAVRRALCRCAACAGETVPDDVLPRLIVEAVAADEQRDP